MIGRALAAVLPYVAVPILSAAVAWQTLHLADWISTMYAAQGDGTLAGYLRHHAYVYIKWFFGTDFGWMASS